MLNADGSRLARRERALAGRATVRRAPNFARCSHDTPRPRASTARIDRPPRAPPPRRPSRVSTSVRAPLALQRKNPTDNSPMLPPYVLFFHPSQTRAEMPYTAKSSRPMKIVFISTEVAPWSKTGGLGDVVGSLPVELAKRGHKVMTVSPRYDQYKGAWDTSVHVARARQAGWLLPRAQEGRRPRLRRPPSLPRQGVG